MHILCWKTALKNTNLNQKYFTNPQGDIFIKTVLSKQCKLETTMLIHNILLHLTLIRR